MELPADLLAFLSQPEKRTIALPGCQIREAVLFAPEELNECEFDVGTADFALQEGWKNWDTRRHWSYTYRAIDLVKACQNYSPKGIMFWLPDLKVYGQWDGDHRKILAFPKATWSDIMREPAPYFDAQWNPEGVPHEFVRPWEEEE